jgi:hypothetical protein
MKHRLLVLAAGLSLLLPAVSLAQPSANGRPSDNRPGDNNGSNRPGGPGDRPGDNGGPNRPGRGMRPPPGPGLGMRPPQRPPQFSWRGRSFSQFRGPMFRYPPGYAYRRWAIGALLPNIFLGTTYYYDDWRGLGIDRPPPAAAGCAMARTCCWSISAPDGSKT